MKSITTRSRSISNRNIAAVKVVNHVSGTLKLNRFEIVDERDNFRISLKC